MPSHALPPSGAERSLPPCSAPLQAHGPAPRLHLGSLLVALVLMLGGSVYPLLLANAQGRADHRLALLLLWAMSAGFVHGVGFVPRQRLWRMLLSAPAMMLALLAALALRLGLPT